MLKNSSQIPQIHRANMPREIRILLKKEPWNKTSPLLCLPYTLHTELQGLTWPMLKTKENPQARGNPLCIHMINTEILRALLFLSGINVCIISSKMKRNLPPLRKRGKETPLCKHTLSLTLI